MTLTLTPDKETRLQRQAVQAGLPLADYLLWVAEHAQTPPTGGSPPMGGPALSPTAALFAQRAAEDATDAPAETARRQHAGNAPLTALRENPLSFRRVDVGGAETGEPEDGPQAA